MILKKVSQVKSNAVLRKTIKDVLRWNRLRLSGHLYRQEETSWTKKIMSLNLYELTSRSRPKLRWKDVVNTDLYKKHLNITLASDRSKWRNDIVSK